MSVNSRKFEIIAASTTNEILRQERLEFFGFFPSGGTEVDNINPIGAQTMIRDMNELWLNNPLAYRIIETQNDYVTGDGLSYQACDENVQEVIDKYYNDPRNRWRTEFARRIGALSLNGEMILKTEVSENAGRVIIANKYPGNVEEVFRREGDDEQIAALTISNVEGRQDVIHPFLTSEGGIAYKGDVFYFAVNKQPFQSRGLSDIYVTRDWLRIYDKAMYSTAKRSGLLLSFIWDITLNNANPEQLRKKYRQILNNPPVPGGFRVHNETEKWEEKTPNLGGRDLAEIFKLIREPHIAGSGMPEFMYGLGGDVNLACHTDDTETLTEDGWKFIDEIGPSHKIATYNPKTRKIEYHIPTQRYEYDVKDTEVYFLKNQNIDLAVTPEHRMYVKKFQFAPYKIHRMKDIKCKQYKLLDGVDGYPESDVDFFILPACENTSNPDDPARKIPMGDWVEFLGHYISEGGMAVKDMDNRSSYHLTLCQKDNWQKMDANLAMMGFSYDKHSGKNGKSNIMRFNVYGKQLCTWLRANCGGYCHEKRIPREFLSLDREYLEILFDALMYGDGSWDKRPGRECGYYSTISEQLADDIQELAFKLGYRAKKTLHYKAYGVRQNCYRVLISNRRPSGYRVNAGKGDVEKTLYTGRVYCFEVPNHLFITRRNGCISIQGNTARVMGGPFFRQVKARQKYVEEIFRQQFEYVIYQAEEHGLLTDVEDKSFTVVLPEPNDEKVHNLAETLLKFANSVVILQTNGYISAKEAQAVVSMLVGQLGVDIEISEDEQELGDEAMAAVSKYLVTKVGKRARAITQS